MTYTRETPIKGTARGNPTAIGQWAMQQGAARIAALYEYLLTMYNLAPALGINADVVVAQSLVEATADDDDAAPAGTPWASDWWVDRLNPAGIGITGDPAQNAASRGFATGAEAARAHLLHLHLYTNGATVPTGFLASDDPRWQAAIDAGYAGIADTLADLNQRWAIDRENDYGGKIASRMNLMESAGLLTGTNAPQPTAPIPPKEPPMATHRFILSAGHRNLNRGGAYREIDWTYPSVKAIKAAIEKRGGLAWIVQEEDGDKDPSFFLNGGLQQAAAKCVELAKVHGPFKAYISSHYDSSPGFHAIFPDSPSGGVDVKANNPLDVRLCFAIRDAVKTTGTVPMKSWPAAGPGVMSERETRVGADGYRLGEFYGTVGFRQETARVILEASGTGDPYIWKPGWVETVYAEAVVNGLEAVFGKFREAVPEPPPGPVYAARSPIPQLATLPVYLALANGAQLIRVNHVLQAMRETSRLKWAIDTAPETGPKVKEGELVDVSYLIVNADDSLWWYTPEGDRLRFDDAIPFAGDVDDGTAPAEVAA
jgi:hypothetical protein